MVGDGEPTRDSAHGDRSAHRRSSGARGLMTAMRILARTGHGRRGL